MLTWSVLYLFSEAGLLTPKLGTWSGAWVSTTTFAAVTISRELPIRQLMGNTGIDLTLYGPASSDNLEGEGETGLAENMEDGESDEEGEFEDDPVCF